MLRLRCLFPARNRRLRRRVGPRYWIPRRNSGDIKSRRTARKRARRAPQEILRLLHRRAVSTARSIGFPSARDYDARLLELLRPAYRRSPIRRSASSSFSLLLVLPVVTSCKLRSRTVRDTFRQFIIAADLPLSKTNVITRRELRVGILSILRISKITILPEARAATIRFLRLRPLVSGTLRNVRERILSGEEKRCRVKPFSNRDEKQLRASAALPP